MDSRVKGLDSSTEHLGCFGDGRYIPIRQLNFLFNS